MANPYAYWQARQRGEDPACFVSDNAQLGFYRKKNGGYFKNTIKGVHKRRPVTWTPVAIFLYKGTVTGRYGISPNTYHISGIELDEQWPFLCKNNISEEMYRAVSERGEPWPDLPNPKDDVPQKEIPDHDPIVSEVFSKFGVFESDNKSIIDFSEKVSTALNGVGTYSLIEDDQTSTKAAGLRNLLLKLSNDADKARSAEKSPYLTEAKNVDAKWQPIVKQAKTGADVIRKALEDWESTKLVAVLQASERINKATREHADSIIRASQNGESLPSLIAPTISPSNLPPPATQIKPTYGKAAAVRTYQSVVEIDIDKVFQASKDKPEVLEFFKDLAQKYVFEGVLLDGVKTEERVKIR